MPAVTDLCRYSGEPSASTNSPTRRPALEPRRAAGSAAPRVSTATIARSDALPARPPRSRVRPRRREARTAAGRPNAAEREARAQSRGEQQRCASVRRPPAIAPAAAERGLPGLPRKRRAPAHAGAQGVCARLSQHSTRPSSSRPSCSVTSTPPPPPPPRAPRLPDRAGAGGSAAATTCALVSTSPSARSTNPEPEPPAAAPPCPAAACASRAWLRPQEARRNGAQHGCCADWATVAQAAGSSTAHACAGRRGGRRPERQGQPAVALPAPSAMQQLWRACSANCESAGHAGGGATATCTTAGAALAAASAMKCGPSATAGVAPGLEPGLGSRPGRAAAPAAPHAVSRTRSRHAAERPAQ